MEPPDDDPCREKGQTILETKAHITSWSGKDPEIILEMDKHHLYSTICRLAETKTKEL